MRARSILIAACLAVLASCGAPPNKGRLMHPTRLDATQFAAPGIPGSFGDTKPHEWNEPSPARYPIHGLDAARYQGPVVWSEAHDAGISFAWLKATEGGDYIDPGYATNAPLARQAGVAVGAYHFYYFCRDPVEQARWFIRQAPPRKGDLPPVLDIEWNHGSSCRRHPSPAQVRAEMRAFLQVVEARYGTRPLIYTTVDFWHDNALNRLGPYEFWLRSVAGHPDEVYPNARWTFWQYTGTGVVPGVGGITDLNAFAGDTGSWIDWLALRRQR